MKGVFSNSEERSAKLRMAWANKSAEEKAMISAKRTGRPALKITYNQGSHLCKVYRQTHSVEAVAKEGGIGKGKAIALLKTRGVYAPSKRGRPSKK